MIEDNILTDEQLQEASKKLHSALANAHNQIAPKLSPMSSEDFLIVLSGVLGAYIFECIITAAKPGCQLSDIMAISRPFLDLTQNRVEDVASSHFCSRGANDELH